MQRLEDWIGAHERAFAFFGGTPEILVPDNLKAAVQKAHRYEPDLNPTYVELAAHYGTVVIPARPRKPRDKAKVEAGVGHVERYVLARLRHRAFFSLAELNRAVGELLQELNEAPFQKLPGSRRSLFEELDRPALRPLPKQPYELALWKQVLVPMDYHVEVEGHYYSVPHELVRRRLDVRLTSRTVECFYRGRRVASHARSSVRGAHTTVHAHRPKAHRVVAEWDPERLLAWAEHAGEATGEVIVTLLEGSAHREQGMRSALAVIRLERSYGADRLEAAHGVRLPSASAPTKAWLRSSRPASTGRPCRML